LGKRTISKFFLKKIIISAKPNGYTERHKHYLCDKRKGKEKGERGKRKKKEKKKMMQE